MPKLRYPIPPTAEQVDDYHGTRVPDPYRPLEDTDAPETRAWIAAENVLTHRILDGAPERGAIRDRLAELWKVPRAGAPWRRGERWFQLRNDGLQDQDVLWTADGPEDGGRVLFDPNQLNDERTTAIVGVGVSESGELVAVATSDAGSDWQTWHVFQVATGELLPDRIDWSKFSSAAWTHDDAGFFYGCYPEPPANAAYEAPNRDMEIRYHRLGTHPADDLLVFSTPDEPEWGFEPGVSEDGRYLVVVITRGTDPETRVYLADLENGLTNVEVRPLLAAADARYEPIAVVDGTMYVLTDLDAPLGRVIAIDVDDPAHPREVIPEGDDALERVRLVGDRLALAYLHHAYHRLAILELDGRHVTDVALPGIGKIVGMAGRRADSELFLTFMTFAAPESVLAVRMADGAVRPGRRPTLPWDPSDFETEQVFVVSGDGTKVPMFLAHRSDLDRDSGAPVVLHGYGGFNISIGPKFLTWGLAWMERGGVLAVASLRGGREYGQAWHDAGRLENKQNVFDDFAACARWLTASGWAQPSRIGIIGASNGGLLVGASLTQHPELFGAALAVVGVMDMLRFHNFTIGWAWTSDYGSADDPAQFRTLLAYSPLHNIRRGVSYPATLVTTGDHDDRVVPGHSFKFAAALQAAQAGDAPILIRIDTDAGHGQGKPVSKIIDEYADWLTFLEITLRSPSEGSGTTRRGDRLAGAEGFEPSIS